MTHFQKLLLGAFVTIFLLSGCLSSPKKVQPTDTTAATTETKTVETTPDKNAAPEPSEEKTEKPKVKQPTETGTTAVESPDKPAETQTVTSEEQKKNEATLEIARNEGNLDKCQTITDPDLKTLCLQSILINKAVETKDKKYCDQMITESVKNECLKLIN